MEVRVLCLCARGVKKKLTGVGGDVLERFGGVDFVEEIVLRKQTRYRGGWVIYQIIALHLRWMGIASSEKGLSVSDGQSL